MPRHEKVAPLVRNISRKVVQLANGQARNVPRLDRNAGSAVALFGKERARELDFYTENPEPERALEVRLGDVNAVEPSLVVRLEPPAPAPIVLREKRVYGVTVHDAGFKTADGLGVGSTMRQISARHRVEVTYNDGALVAIAADLGMTFDFAIDDSIGGCRRTLARNRCGSGRIRLQRRQFADAAVAECRTVS